MIKLASLSEFIVKHSEMSVTFEAKLQNPAIEAQKLAVEAQNPALEY